MGLAGVTAVKNKLQVQIVSVQQSLAGSPRLDQQADTSLCQLDAAHCGPVEAHAAAGHEKACQGRRPQNVDTNVPVC